jgi:site-specific recombinase XerD
MRTNITLAAKGLKDAAQNLKKINSAYSAYKKTLKQAEADYKAGKIDKQDLQILKDYNVKYIAAISLAAATFAGKTAAIRSLHNFLFCLFSALCSNFNTQNTVSIPAFKIFVSLTSEATALLSSEIQLCF